MGSSASSHAYVVRNLIYALVLLWVVLLIGTVGYRFLGGSQYSWVDCFYMTFITISTIGFTEAVDVTHYEYGRIFTVFIGLSGIGILGYVISTITAFLLESNINIAFRRKKMLKTIAKLQDHFIVCGAGRVGSNVVHELEMTGRPCVFIDSDMASIDSYLATHPAQLYLHGDATADEVLIAAGINQARGVFAVAHDDNQNLVISLSAKQLNPGVRVVARCHDMKNIEKVRRAGADEIVSPDFTGGLRLVSAMLRPQVVNFLDDMLKSEDGLRMEEFILPGNLDNKKLSDLQPGDQDFVVLAIRQEQGKWTFNPPAQHELHGGDIMMVMASPQGRVGLEELMQTASV